MKNVLLVSTLVFSMFSSGEAFARRHRAQGPKGMRGRGRAPHPGAHHKGRKGNLFTKILFLKKVLGLTPAQTAQIMKINLNFKIRHINYKKVLVPLRLELKKRSLMEKLDIKKIQQVLIKLSRYEVNMRLLKFQQQKRIMGLLNPQQQLKLRYLLLMSRKHGKR